MRATRRGGKALPAATSGSRAARCVALLLVTFAACRAERMHGAPPAVDSGAPQGAAPEIAAEGAVEELAVRTASVDVLFPRRWGKRVVSVEFRELRALPDTYICLGTAVSLNAEGLTYVAREQSGPGIMMRGLHIEARAMDTVTVDIRLKSGGVVVKPERVRFFWFRSGDVRQPGNDWPFSEERQVTLGEDPSVSPDLWIARVAGHPNWTGLVEEACVEISVPESIWNADVRCEVIIRSVVFWDNASRSGAAEP